VFLASNADSSYITGIVLPILGGEPSADEGQVARHEN
jgi:hypothetical protein